MESKGLLMEWGAIERVTSSITPLLFQALRGERAWREVLVEFLRLYVREGSILSAFFSMLVDDDVLVRESIAKLVERINSVGVGGTITSLELEPKFSIALRLETPFEVDDFKDVDRAKLHKLLKKIDALVTMEGGNLEMGITRLALTVLLWDVAQLLSFSHLSFNADALTRKGTVSLGTALMENTYDVRSDDADEPPSKKRRI